MSEQTDILTEQREEAAPKVLEVPSTLKFLVEALLFAAEEPLSIRQLKALYEYSAPAGSGEERKIEADALRAIVTELNAEYKKQSRPYRIIQIAGGYQFATLKEYADWVGKLRREQSRKKLSQSGIETLAIIAYKQPITKAEVEAIRGVNCDYVLKTLLEKDLVRVTGRAETVGRPLLYGSTRDFLVHFGLNEVTDLPRPREIEEILGETQFETERRMLEAQAAADKIAEEEEPFKSRLPHIPKRRSDLSDATVEIRSRKQPTMIQSRTASDTPMTPESTSEADAQPVVSAEERSTARPAPEPPVQEHQTPPERDTQTIAQPPALDKMPEIVPRSAEAEPLGEGTQRSRWHTWKEKIQGFIKKLFD